MSVHSYNDALRKYIDMWILLSASWTSQAIHAKCPYTSFCIALCLCLEQKLFNHQLAFA